MIAICPNEKCKAILSVENNKVIAANGVLICPDCTEQFMPPPLVAKCGNKECGKQIKYYDWKIKDPNKPYIVCPHCKKVNKVKFRTSTFLTFNKEKVIK